MTLRRRRLGVGSGDPVACFVGRLSAAALHWKKICCIAQNFWSCRAATPLRGLYKIAHLCFFSFVTFYSCLSDAVDGVFLLGLFWRAFIIAWERATNAFLFDTASVAFDGSGRFEGSVPNLFRDCAELGAENEPEEGTGEPFCIFVGANCIEDVCS